jgi:hypothetical protein
LSTRSVSTLKTTAPGSRYVRRRERPTSVVHLQLQTDRRGAGQATLGHAGLLPVRVARPICLIGVRSHEPDRATWRG